jgi:flavin reductase (DIM6/NTAB) family NADH-FMN oxidoreductase RutF
LHRQSIALDRLVIRPFHTLDKRWMLLTAGPLEGTFNPMTISWGALGTVWNKPFAMTLVRPTRFTYGFLDEGHDFTLSVFPEDLKKRVHGVCGTKSGRDLDKVAATGLTPIPSAQVTAPGFDEAELILECRQIYRDDLDPTLFMDPAIHKLYTDDHHRFWFGEVVAVHGTDVWCV